MRCCPENGPRGMDVLFNSRAVAVSVTFAILCNINTLCNIVFVHTVYYLVAIN